MLSLEHDRISTDQHSPTQHIANGFQKKTETFENEMRNRNNELNMEGKGAIRAHALGWPEKESFRILCSFDLKKEVHRVGIT